MPRDREDGRPARVRIMEVGPRDGLQNEPAPIPTATKIELVNRLSATGLDAIEVSSFVARAAIPQLADAADVFDGIARSPAVDYSALVPNMRGLEAALEAGVRSVAVFTAASESFSMRNTNATIEQSLARFAPVVDAAAREGVHVRGYVSCAFGCPFEGPVAPDAVRDVAARLLDAGINELSIGDTIGVATPDRMGVVLAPVLELAGARHVALHLHDTRGTALANAWAALELGIATFDASVAGLGGCPFAPGATGNVATEDLAWMLGQAGIETGIDLPALIEVARWISERMDRVPAGHVARARTWPWEPEPAV